MSGLDLRIQPARHHAVEEARHAQQARRRALLRQAAAPELARHHPVHHHHVPARRVRHEQALALLYDSFDEPFCRPHLHGFFEDVMVAECFRNGPAKLFPMDTRDETGAERFHPFTPGQHLSYRKTPNDWYTKYSFDLIEGEKYFSRQSTAFHYVKPDLMVHMDAILHRCPKE